MQVDITQLQVSQVGSLGCYVRLEFISMLHSGEELRAFVTVYTQLHAGMKLRIKITHVFPPVQYVTCTNEVKQVQLRGGRVQYT